MMVAMLERPKDLKQERRDGEEIVAGGLVGKILFDAPATANSPEARPETNKLLLCVSSVVAPHGEDRCTQLGIRLNP